MTQDQHKAECQNEQWLDRYQIGVLHIYIDDMETPHMSTFVNIGEMINRDNFYTPGGVAGQAYISITASTQYSAEHNKVLTSTNRN